ncbi:MAG: hypothetical protein IJI20_02585 [Firmicutes bacterium]|nr:hypothetical protein [Bacillota bacterium]
MKTITITSNGRDVQFTTKSVTIDGKEYLYSHISELRHSEAKRVYGFKCDGEVCMLPYEEKDAQTLSIIFSQVQQMHRKAKKPIKEAPAEAPAPAPEEVPVQPVAEEVAEPAAEVAAEPASEEAGYEPEVPAEEVVEPIPEEVPVQPEVPVEEVPVEPAVEEVAEVVEPQVPAEEPAADEFAGVAVAEEAAAAEELAQEATPAEQKKSDREARKEEKRRLKEQRKAEKEAARKKKQEEKEEARRRKQEAKAPKKPAGEAEAPAEPAAEGTDIVPEPEPVIEPVVIPEPEKPAVPEAEEPSADYEAFEGILSKKPTAEEAAAKATEAAAQPAEEIVTFSETEEDTITPEQKGVRFKKSIIIFLVVLAVFALAGLAWYFFIGPASDPQHGVNSTEDTTQYNDINDMINDLEE